MLFLSYTATIKPLPIATFGEVAITADVFCYHSRGSQSNTVPSLKEVTRRPPFNPKAQSANELVEHLRVFK